jgi:hypothetical protein
MYSFPGQFWKLMALLLLTGIGAGCGFKRVGSYYFDKRCHRDLPGVWSGRSCGSALDVGGSGAGGESGGGEGGSGLSCALAINPKLCIDDGIEHSVWRSELRKANIALGYDLSFQSYYEFHSDGSYKHYLVFTHPFLDKRYYEKRLGSLLLENNDDVDRIVYSHTLDFTLNASSCSLSATPSMFRVFDASNKSQISRNDNWLSFRFPDIDFDIAGQDLLSFFANIILNLSELVYEVLLAPLTPNFWKEIITGPLLWEAANPSDLEQMLADSEELCFSEDGFQSLASKLDIPPEVQLILLSQ